MTITANTPYQIFATNQLPASWERAFQDNRSNYPLEFQPQLTSAWSFASTKEFPSRKDESWRWMDYKELDLESLELNSIGSPIRVAVRHVHEDEEHNFITDPLPEGVVVTTLRELIASNLDLAIKLLADQRMVSEGLFAALPSALANDGLVVYVPRDVTVEGVVQCYLEISLENRAAFTKNLIWLEEGANLKLELVWVNDFISQSGFHDGILKVSLGDRSNLHLDERQQFDQNAWNITHEVASLGADVQLIWNYAAVGGNTSKNFIKVEMEGKGSQANLNGVMFPSNGQVINLDTRQNHWAEQTFSNLLFKSVARQEGRSIWHGMIYVDPDARKTDAYQSNKNLILDESADVKSVPGLEIHNDDVKCSHGATMGNVDEEELYYLQARGIPPKEAELLIVEGFCNQVIQSFALETSRKELIDQLMNRISM